MDETFIVVGAGLGGLHAAWRLREAGKRVLLLEARERAGGRILSAPILAGPHRVDLGPSWYWPELNPRLSAWVARLGLQPYPQHSRGGSLSEMEDGAIRRFDDGWTQMPQSQRLVGGMASLIEELLKELEEVPVHCSSRVVAMRLPEGAGIELTIERSGARHRLHATRVISTLPPRLLAQDIQAEPAWPAALRAQWQDTPTWMGGQAKFVAAYDRAFWREAGLSGAAMSQRGPLVEIHDASDADGGQAALFGFLGGSAVQRIGLGQGKLQRLALAQLERLFGAPAAEPRWTALQEWALEPLTASPLDQRPLHHHPDYRPVALPAPWYGRLYLAGTEFAPLNGGYLEGALEAADAAVEQILAGVAS